jgi:DHA2 family multidrug resistance protein
MLVFFRVVQGLGGGGLGPSEQAILADTFPPSRRGMAFAVYGMAVVLAPAIGPTLGGYITDHFSWRWVFFINVPVGIVSLFLSSRMVVDPPWIAEGRSRAGTIDYVGLGLVAVGLGALEFVLDKGQEADWFASDTVTGCAILAGFALVGFVLWEWRQQNPVVDVRLLTTRSFATANLLMVVLGMALFGSTVLLPQYVQVWMGWSAEQAGMALSPGALVVIALLPAVGFLVSRIDARYLIAFGCAVLALSLFHMAHSLYPGIDFRTAVALRAYQSVGLAFLFIPINTIAYAGIPPTKNNAVSGIINLSRNLGGSIGIAFVTTTIARRSQVHQANLTAHLDLGSAALRARLAGLAQAFERAGSSSVDATRRAYGAIYHDVVRQAQTLAYLDALFLLGCFCALMIPLVFVTRRARPGAPAAVH